MAGLSRSLRLQLTVVGFAAIYAPVLLVVGVETATEEDVITGASGVDSVVESSGRSGWTAATIILLAPVALTLAWWWAGRAVGPLDRVRRVADDIEGSDLSRRIGIERGPTEVVALSASFDAMLDRLEESATTQDQLVEETSHALRTPLAVLVTQADVLLAQEGATAQEHRAGWERARAAATRMGTTVEDLLVEARGRSRSIHRTPVDLVSIVRSVVDAAPPGAAVEVEVTGPSITSVDEPTVHRAVANLIDNAIRFAPPGTAVQVQVGDGWVRVTDHGPGLAPEDQARAFSRFWRGDRPGGAGLGIPIAAQVAAAHGGRLTLQSPGAAGDGCEFTLRVAP